MRSFWGAATTAFLARGFAAGFFSFISFFGICWSSSHLVRRRMQSTRRLRDYLRDDACADRLAALADCKAGLRLERHRRYELDLKGHGVARHNHLGACGKRYLAGHIGRSDVELRLVSGEERRVAASFVFGKHVYLAFKLGVRINRTRLSEHLAAVDAVFGGTAQEDAGVVSCLAFLQLLVKHFNAGDGRFGCRLKTDNLDFLAYFDDTALDATGHDSAASFDGEDVFYRHKERLVELAHRHRQVAVERVGEFKNLFGPLIIKAFCFKRFETRAADDRRVGVALLLEEVFYFLLDEVDEVFVIYHVYFVEEYDDLRHADLARKQYVLAGLWHCAVGRGDHEDRAVHLGGTGDHVFNVVCVARRVDVRVVAVRGLVLGVVQRDGNAARLFLRSIVDAVDSLDARAVTLCLCHIKHVENRRRERSLAVVDVADGAYVHVRLSPFESCHK